MRFEKIITEFSNPSASFVLKTHIHAGCIQPFKGTERQRRYQLNQKIVHNKTNILV